VDINDWQHSARLQGLSAARLTGLFYSGGISVLIMIQDHLNLALVFAGYLDVFCKRVMDIVLG